MLYLCRTELRMCENITISSLGKSKLISPLRYKYKMGACRSKKQKNNKNRVMISIIFNVRKLHQLMEPSPENVFTIKILLQYFFLSR